MLLIISVSSLPVLSRSLHYLKSSAASITLLWNVSQIFLNPRIAVVSDQISVLQSYEVERPVQARAEMTQIYFR